jgi:dihydrofolate reductase
VVAGKENEMRKLVYNVAVSQDGYIAGPDGEFDAFLFEGDHMEAINERYVDGANSTIARQLGWEQRGDTFGAVLMGANTYAVGLPDFPSPYEHLDQYVLTHRPFDPVPGVNITDREPVELVRELKSQDGADIWLCGGGNLATQLIGEIDRLVLKRNPVTFGAGIPLFAPGDYEPVRWKLVSDEHFESGLTFATYERG